MLVSILLECSSHVDLFVLFALSLMVNGNVNRVFYVLLKLLSPPSISESSILMKMFLIQVQVMMMMLLLLLLVVVVVMVLMVLMVMMVMMMYGAVRLGGAWQSPSRLCCSAVLLHGMLSCLSLQEESWGWKNDGIVGTVEIVEIVEIG